MRFLTAFVFMILIAGPVAAATKGVSNMDEALARIQSASSSADTAVPVAFIVAHAGEAPAVHLFVACTAAMGAQRLEDAAFLFYIAQFRARYDLVRFPPKATGAESPAVVLGALSQQIGSAVNPAIMREPKAFANVVKRVEAWSPATPAGYDPQWEYSAVNDENARRLFSTQRESFSKQVGGLAKLLNDPRYFAAFRIVQDFNFSTAEEMKDPARREAKKAAEATMLEIETKRRITGLYYRGQ